MENIRGKRTHDDNPQLILKSMKEDFTGIFRQQEKVAIPKMEKDIREMKDELKKTLNDPLMGEDERQTEAAAVQEKIDATERIRFQKIRDNTAARNRLDGESTTTSYWTSSNKSRKPRDPTFSLQIPGSDPPLYETRSDKMAELARNFHEGLQSEGIAPPEEQEEATRESLKNVKKLSQQHKAKLSQYLTREDVARVIRQLPNGKAPGIDGLIHELWKTINEKYEKSKDSTNKSMDIAKMLCAVYNDIEQYGVHPDTNFAEGW
ncbi:hypothetical protein K438DRAFT_1645470, partial [Mycena galopus ATCC 62051]